MFNALKTTFLLGSLTGLLMAAGYGLGGAQGMQIMLLVSALMNLGTWFFSDSIVLATSGAVPIEDPRLRWLEDDVADLAQRAGMPKPRVFVVPREMSPNAFATGRSPTRGVVAVTAGLLNTLDRRQIRGVLAHELGHIKNRDTLISAVAATVAGAISNLAHMAMWFGVGGRRDEDRGNPLVGLLIMIVAPLAATMIHLAISRTREYGADATAAQITGDPQGLADALERIAFGGVRHPMETGTPSTHYIANNFAGGMGKLFSTHPPMEERVARLRAMRTELR
jgi:heat shock protein HtpX